MKTADVNDTPLTQKGPLPLPKPFKETSILKAAGLGVWLDVSEAKVSPALEKRAGRLFCLSNPDRYPIDDLKGVKLANVYFEQHYDRFDPLARREYATSLAKQASSMAEPVGPMTRLYSSNKLASDLDLSVGWKLRREFVKEADRKVLDKLASTPKGQVQADDYACLMHAFDKRASITHLYDREIYDPWRTVLAEEEAPAYFTEVIGTDTIMQDDISHLARTPAGQHFLRKVFGSDFMVKFLNDPLGTYRSQGESVRQLIGRQGRTLRCGGPGGGP